MNTERFFEFIKGKKIALCGAGRSHMPLAKIFTEKEAIVTVRDERTPEGLGENYKILQKSGIRVITGKSYLDNLDEDFILRTPGMQFNLPELEKARRNGQVVTSELELFFELCPCKIYGVTGSDGKTTTTTIISEFLRAQGKTVHLGGNIGKPLLPEIERINEDDIAVVELSSFQLLSMRQSPDVAVLTNITPNHLDWHTDMDEYVEAKKQVFIHQNALSKTVLNADNDITASFLPLVRGDAILFSRQHSVPRGVWCENGAIFANAQRILDISDIRISGAHNIENYLAAIGAVLGEVEHENIVKVAKNFDGVEHRMEFVRELDGVKYYNDSIATSPSRTISGTLSLYEEKIILLCGGYDKQIPYDTLGPVICSKVKLLILMGATADKIEQAVKQSPNYAEDVPSIIRVQNMAEAVITARKQAESGDIVSLSPASAGFDLYPNFEVRGRHFKELVNDLK